MNTRNWRYFAKYRIPTIAAANPAAAATPSAQRGPNLSATQPTTGAAKGVPPNAIAKKIAITRPRMAGSVDSCMVLFVVVVMVCADTLITTSARPKNP